MRSRQRAVALPPPCPALPPRCRHAAAFESTTVRVEGTIVVIALTGALVTAAEPGAMHEWRFESERATWPVVAGRPHAALRGLLARPYVGVTAASAPHRLLLPASAAIPLVLKLEDSEHRPPAFLLGAHDRSLLMDGDCARSYIEVCMAPLGAYRLLGRPLTELGDTVVDLQHLFGAAGRRLLETVREAGSWRHRFAALDAFLVTAAQQGPRPSPEVVRAWQLLVGSRGGLQVSEVAAEVGWSHKHLITRFRQQVGVTPKTAARLMRFESVVRRARRDSALRWDQIAAEGGYADQAHLIRDFHAFAGSTPTTFAERNRQAPSWSTARRSWFRTACPSPAHAWAESTRDTSWSLPPRPAPIRLSEP